MSASNVLRSHLELPSTCPFCGKKCSYWVDGTYGCEDGHVVAYSKETGLWGTVWFWIDPRLSTPKSSQHSGGTQQ